MARPKRVQLDASKWDKRLAVEALKSTWEAQGDLRLLGPETVARIKREAAAELAELVRRHFQDRWLP